ncbi:MAG: 30S ribosomal protein S2 [Gammaproteobacteria bacterium]|jgi:small subunit ribosomal protein S2|nr:30S ribosomal protein S2 [Gammaproteobacteria bacterium]
MTDITIPALLEAGVHFGHQTSYWNPKMAPYIYGNRNHIHIIDIQKTVPLLKDACAYAEKISAGGGKILFVGTKRAARDIISKASENCNMPYVNHRWLGGMLTNFNTVRQSIKRLKALEEESEKENKELTKKEQLLQSREIQKLNNSLGGIKEMKSIPDALFIIDVGYEDIAVKEAMKLGIPIIAVVDTNNSFDNIDYFFPGNDDSMRAIDLYCSEISNAVKKGQEFLKTKQPAVTKEEIIRSPAKNTSDERVVVKKKKNIVKKVATKKVATKKVATKKVATKKVATKKVATKKVATKKATTKKVATKKATSKKSKED